MPGPDSPFVGTEWGFVRRDFEGPDAARPIIVEIDGYAGASVPYPTHYVRVRDGTYIALRVDLEPPYGVGSYGYGWPEYAYVHASVRGTGCSGGSFDLMDRTQALDGRDVIEFLAGQPWSTGNVGLYGNSYSGVTALLVASTQPASLKAVHASAIFADGYRDVLYPGGILNEVFPGAWLAAIRPAADRGGSFDSTQAGDDVCSQNVAARPPRNPQQDAALAAFLEDEDTAYWQVRSPLMYAADVRVPLQLTEAFQDQQVGPRGAVEYFNAIHPDPIQRDGKWIEPKVVVASNGVHNSAEVLAISEAKRWFDEFLLGKNTGILEEDGIRIHFGTRIQWNQENDGRWNATDISFEHRVTSPAWPIPGTSWIRYYFHPGGGLQTVRPPATAMPSQYPAGIPRGGWVWNDGDQHKPHHEMRGSQGPEVVAFTSEPLDSKAVVAGPIAVTLYASTTAPDTDFFVTIADVNEAGVATYLQKGLLRASHRAIDHERSIYNEARELVRPFHPHTGPQPVVAGTVEEYSIEIMPLAHAFPTGHRIRVEIATPPLSDGQWGYAPHREPGINTVYHDDGHDSSILLPVFATSGSAVFGAACGMVEGYICTPLEG